MMKHFIDRSSGEVFAYEADGSQDDLIVENLEPLTEKELHDIRNPQRTEEELASEARHVAKVTRTRSVSSIKVTVGTGNTFDGNEVSQSRMALEILVMRATGAATTVWVLADNSVATVSEAELVEALVAARNAKAELWLI